MSVWVCNTSWQLSDGNKGPIRGHCKISEINYMVLWKLKHMWVMLFRRTETCIMCEGLRRTSSIFLISNLGCIWACSVFIEKIQIKGGLMAQWWRLCLPMQETQVQSLSQEDPLEKDMTTHSSILAWKIPWAEKPGGLQSMGLQKSWTQLSN